jgi:WD40 repeat protein
MSLRVWRVDPGTPLLDLTNDFARSPEFSPDDQHVILFHQTNSVWVYDLASGRRVASYPVAREVANFKLHPEGQQLAISYTGGNLVQLLDLASGRISNGFTAPEPVQNLAWHPGGRWLAAAGRYGNNVLWDTATSARSVIKAHSSASIGLDFAPRGSLLASAGWDYRLRLQDCARAIEICSLPSALYGAWFSPDSRWLGYGSALGKASLAQVSAGSACAELYTEYSSGEAQKGCAFSTDGRWLATAHGDGFRIWDVGARRLAAFQPTAREIISVRFHPIRSALITDGAEGVAEWPFTTNRDARSPEFVVGKPTRLAAAADSQWDYLACNGESLAIASGDTVQLLDLQSEGPPRRTLQGGVDFRFTALSPDGKWCAAGSWLTNSVWVFDLASGQTAQLLPAGASTSSLCFSPNSQWLVLCGAEEFRFVRTGSWRLAATVQRKANGTLPGKAAFSPDSRLTALIYSGQLIRLVDPATGNEVATLEPRELENLASLAFSPDGATLAATTWTKVIQLWDLRFIRAELAALNLNWE